MSDNIHFQESCNNGLTVRVGDGFATTGGRPDSRGFQMAMLEISGPEAPIRRIVMTSPDAAREVAELLVKDFNK